MISYSNLGGNSNVHAYHIDVDSITVQFKDGGNYYYNYITTGKQWVERMKYLALQGVGLNAFISSVVKKRYARKW